MAAKLNFFRWLATSVAALGVMSVIGGTGLAQSTWTGATSAAWGTAGNWSGGVPVASGTAILSGTNTGNRYALTLPTAGTNPLKLLQVNAGNSAYSTNTNALNLAEAGVINNSRKTSSGAPGFTAGNLVLTGSTASVGGTGYSKLNAVSTTGSEIPALLTLTSGSTQVVATTDVSLQVSSGATLVTNGSTLGDVTVKNGGVVSPVAGQYLNTDFGDLVLEAGSKAIANIGYADSVTMVSDTYAPTTITYGGELSLNLGGVGTDLFESWTATQIFTGAKSGSFSSVTLAGASSPYSGLTFGRVGTEWVSGTFAGYNGETQWLVFSETNGNLVVVPEPSTIVFAGVGVAMAGWSAWKKRRLSKVLAKS